MIPKVAVVLVPGQRMTNGYNTPKSYLPKAFYANPKRTSSRATSQCALAGWWPYPDTDFKRFPLDNFTYYLTLFSKFFATFPHGTCSLSVSRQYLALEDIYLPICAAFSNYATLWKRIIKRWTQGRTGLSPSMALLSSRLGPRPSQKTFLETTIRTPIKMPDFKFELFPLHSPLLGESLLVSFPPLIDMLKFSGSPSLIWDQSSGVQLLVLPYSCLACSSESYTSVIR